MDKKLKMTPKTAEEKQAGNAENQLDVHQEIELSWAASVMTKPGDWQNKPVTIVKFVEILKQENQGKKDGRCYTQGPLKDGVRDQNSILKSHIVVFDLSNGMTGKQIDAKLKKSELAYVRHSTHGHLAEQTVVKANKYNGFAKQVALTEKSVRSFLSRKKGFTKSLLEKCQMDIGEAIAVVEHPPLEKHHVVLFLSEPFVFHGEGINNEVAQKRWRKLYEALAKKLGLKVALDCIDPGHTFYLPRHREGIEPVFNFVKGQKVDLLQIEQESEACSALGPRMIAAQDLPVELEELNQHHALVMLGGKSRIVMTSDSGYQFLEKPTFFDYYANRLVDLGDHPISIAKHWFKWRERKEYTRVVFDPSGNCPAEHFNFWRGFAVEPKEGDWSLLRKHMLDNICQGEERYFKWLMCWIAQIFQQPAEKLGTAVVIRGEKGTGKSFLANWISALLGSNASAASQARHVTGNFNAHLAQLLFLVADEAFWAGSKQDEGALKVLISGPSMMLERKGIDVEQADSYVRLMILSNNDWVVPATKDERRFFCLECGTATQQNGKYFAAIEAQMKNGGAEAMLHDLLRYDFSQVDLRNPPRTKWLAEQIDESLSDVQAWLRTVLEEGELVHAYQGQLNMLEGGEKEPPTLFSENEQRMQDVPSKLAYQSFSNFVKNTQYGLAFSQAKFGKHLAKEMPCIKKQRKQEGGKRVYYYRFPSLEVMRDEFTEKTGIEFERDVVEAKPKKSKEAELAESLMLSEEEKMDIPDNFELS